MIKKFFSKIWQGWKKFAHILGKFNTKIILTIFFFLVLGPISLLRRFFSLFKKKPIQSSFWIKKELKEQAIEDYYQQF